MTDTRLAVVVIATLLALGAALSAAFGYVSPDSWNYIRFAQSIRQGLGCSIDSVYFAVQPCGYGLAIALTGFSGDLADLIVSSKFTNLVLTGSSFWLLARTFRNILVPIAVIFNPITMAIYQFTWSENLFLFAVCGSFYALSRINRGETVLRNTVLLALFLLIGCSSRYFFGPFAAMAFLCAFACYGWRAAVRFLPAFVAAGIFFAAYQHYNEISTGYATGMLRIPAPESLQYLLAHFHAALLRDGRAMFHAALILLILSWRCWSTEAAIRKEADELRDLVFLLLVGGGFLLLAFGLRLRTQYDLYGYRTIGYGSVFVFAACIGLFTRTASHRYPVFALLIAGLFAIFQNQERVLWPQMEAMWRQGYRSPSELLANYHAPAVEAEIIVALQVPLVAERIADLPQIYYPPGPVVILVDVAPYKVPDTEQTLRAKVALQKLSTCVVDFTPFPTQESFQAYIDSDFAADLAPGPPGQKDVTVGQPRLHASLRNYLTGIFQPGRYVPCGM